MNTAGKQTNPTKRIVLGVVAPASHETREMSMLTSTNIFSTETDGNNAVAAVCGEAYCAPIAMIITKRRSEPAGIYGHYWSTANIREEVPR